jgi:hypothetical protein
MSVEPERLMAAEITAALMAVVEQPEGVWLSRPVTAGGLVDVMIQGGRVCLALDLERRPVMVLEASGPDGRTWEWGCQRDWEAEGAPVVDPLTVELRERLGGVLAMVPATPLQQDAVGPDLEAVARRQLEWKNKQRRRKAKAAA